MRDFCGFDVFEVLSILRSLAEVGRAQKIGRQPTAKASQPKLKPTASEPHLYWRSTEACKKRGCNPTSPVRGLFIDGVQPGPSWRTCGCSRSCSRLSKKYLKLLGVLRKFISFGLQIWGVRRLANTKMVFGPNIFGPANIPVALVKQGFRSMPPPLEECRSL